jgi:hypothetical protein
MNVDRTAKRCAGRGNCHGAAASTRLHRASPDHAGAVRHDDHVERAMCSCASEVSRQAVYAPPPATLGFSSVMRQRQKIVRGWGGGHICAGDARYGGVLGDPRAESGSHQIGENPSQQAR